MSYKITSNFSRNIVPLRQLKPFKPNIRDIRYCDMNFFSQNSNISDWKNIPILRKFVNINEHSKLLLKIFNFEFFSNFSHKKNNTLSLVNIKNTSALNHFTPAEKLRIFKLKSKEIAFLKPFARQKNYMGKFNYSIDNLLEINNESENNKNRYMDLMFTRLNFDDVKTLVQDKNIDTTDFRTAIRNLRLKYAKNINNLTINKVDDKYQIVLTTIEPNVTYKFSYTKSKKNSANTKKMTLARFYAIEDINNEISKVVEYNRSIRQHNFETLNSGNGDIKKYSKRIESGSLIQAWQSGKIMKEDIMNWFTEYPDCISRKDFQYFARKKFQLTPFDNDKVIEARYYTATHSKLNKESDYYKAKESGIIQSELEKLKGVDSHKKIIIIDGLPGAGKSSLIEYLLKQTRERFYISDSDNIKQYFSEYYNDGIGAEVVHKAASYLYKNKLIPEVMAQGKNLIYQTSGSYAAINRLLKKAHELGYTVDFINVDTSLSTCIKRATDRMDFIGRFIDPCVILEIARKNANAKNFMAEIMSHNPYVSKTYKCQNYELKEVKEGEIKKSYDLDKSKWYLKFRRFIKGIL